MILNPVIAIDGPAASGKSTVARLVAANLGFVYVDTGAMYRAFAWAALEKNIDPSDRSAVKNLIATSGFRIHFDRDSVRLEILGTDPAPHIRGERINATVSHIASIPELREFLVIRQRELRNHQPLVMEGRDIGTVVFTDTPNKFFIDADPTVRAERRKGEGQSDATARRDALDRARAVAPLTCAADAHKLDSTHDNAQVIADKILAFLRERGIQQRA
jgi:cytidylate kinase